MTTTVVLFTRDLRIHDNPTLYSAVRESDRVVPLFVLDEAILASSFNRPNRAAFLADTLADLDEGLRRRGGSLVVRHGDVVRETVRVAEQAEAATVHLSADVSGYGQSRQRRLSEGLASAGRALRLHDDTSFVVPPGAVHPAGRDHMAVFTPYLRQWLRYPRRSPLPPPHRFRASPVPGEKLPSAAEICRGPTAPRLPAGGETAARRRLNRWLRGGLADYAQRHNALAVDGTSRLSAYLHFGCLSPVELVVRAVAHGGDGAEEFVRQVAWRDFHHQVLAARPDAATRDYRPRGHTWSRSRRAFDAWRKGRTGIPIVDAGMRQLVQEGWMHNRARLIVSYYLCKELRIDWRWGARHFSDLLVDADVANNTMNWQWVAGTGNDTRFNRRLNLDTQAKRYDSDGAYVRRYSG